MASVMTGTGHLPTSVIKADMCEQLGHSR